MLKMFLMLSKGNAHLRHHLIQVYLNISKRKAATFKKDKALNIALLQLHIVGGKGGGYLW